MIRLFLFSRVLMAGLVFLSFTACAETQKVGNTLAGFPSLINEWTETTFGKKETFYGTPLLGESFEQVLDIQEIQTRDGVAAWLVKDESVPVISIRFAFRGGATMDPEGKEGLAHLTATLLNEGAGDLDSQAFQKIMMDNAIDLYFSAGRDAFYGQLRTTSENKETAFNLLKKALLEPRFDEEAVTRMKNAVLSSLKLRQSSPDYFAGRAMNSVVYDGHPYARPVHGTEETVASITQDDLKKFVRDRLARGNLIVAVSGDISADETQTMLENTFSGLPPYAMMPPIPQANMRAKGKTVMVPWEGPQSIVLMVQNGLNRESKDWIPAKMINYILAGGGFKSRLMEELRVKRGLTYGISSALVDRDQGPIWMVQTSIENDNVAESVKLIEEQWHFMAAAGMTEKELETAKSFLIGALPIALDSTGAIASVMLQMQEDSLPIDYLNRRTAEINAVTLDDIKRVASTYLKPESLTTIVVGSPQDLQPQYILEKEKL